MIVTYFGKEFFKLQFGDTIVAFNPPSKDSKLKTSRFGADVALVSVNDKDHNGVENLSFGDKKPFVISGPGEYEVKNIFIKGVPSETSVGAGKKLNTIYLLSVDKMNICFLGALSSKNLPSESREAIDEVDILFAPVGGRDGLSVADAYSVAISLEPKIIIPMDYEDGSPSRSARAEADEAFKKFLKEGGAQKTESLDKFTVKQKDIEGKDEEIVVLAAQS